MGGDPRDRLHWKNAFHSLEVELQHDFNLSPVASRALIRRLDEFIDTFVCNHPEARAPGQISYPAVAIGERAGKPIRYCLTIPVSLTMLHDSDYDVLHNVGAPALRQTRLARLCNEAHQQGAALSHEDLALLLITDPSTVRRLVKSCADDGQQVPTRGIIQDIGPSSTHKRDVIDLFFRGLLPAHIAARIGHRLGSVERYLADFARVVHLRTTGLNPAVIMRITGLSPRTVDSYLELFATYDRPEHKPLFDRLMVRFGSVEDLTDAEVHHG